MSCRAQSKHLYRFVDVQAWRLTPGPFPMEREASRSGRDASTALSMTVLLSMILFELALFARILRTHRVLFQPGHHLLNLDLLLGDDALGQAAQGRVFAV